jgi:hypothetical protein
MPKRKLKTHLHRSTRSTWCGKEIEANTGSPENREGTVPSSRVTRDTALVTCATCIKADAAEQRHQK